VSLGVSSGEAEKALRQIYVDVIRDGAAVVVTDPATAELVKVAANAFLATKVTFANLMGELCEAAGADVTTLAESIGLDPRIGPQFLGAGLGFGGGCLPKDLRALIARADELGVGHARRLLGVVDEVNEGQRVRTVETAVELCGGSVAGVRIAALGAAFKPGTDDVRDSPSLAVAARLRDLGATVTVHDPHANDNARAAEPDLCFAATAEDACRDASLVVLLTEWEELVRLDPRQLSAYVAVPRMLDARNALDPQRWQLAGWEHRGFGRSSDRAQPSAGSRVSEMELMQ